MDSPHLSMLNWNVRGLNDAAHKELVRETMISSRPSLVCLQETKLATLSDSLARDTLGLALNSYLELGAQGTRGGILLAWDKELLSITNAVNRVFTITATVQC